MIPEGFYSERAALCIELIERGIEGELTDPHKWRVASMTQSVSPSCGDIHETFKMFHVDGVTSVEADHQLGGPWNITLKQEPRMNDMMDMLTGRTRRVPEPKVFKFDFEQKPVSPEEVIAEEASTPEPAWVPQAATDPAWGGW